MTTREHDEPLVKAFGTSCRALSSSLSPTVLVVEDQALLRFLAADMLAEAGYSFHLAEDAEQAFQILADFDDIDLIFADINMSGPADGLLLARRIRAQWSEIGIVLTSGATPLSAAELPTRSLFLSKPYRWDDVYDCLERVNVHSPR